MPKLQLYISKSQRGFKSLVNLNPWDEVQRHIHDLDRAVGAVAYDPAVKNIFYAISYIDSGCFFTIIRTIPERSVDHLEATIFIPAVLDIDAAALRGLIDRTAAIISAASVSSDDLAELRNLYAADYPVLPDEFSYIPSEGRQNAVMALGADGAMTLDQFLAARYQPAFVDFDSVVLLPEGSPLKAAEGARTIAAAAASTIALAPPEARSDGFTPHIFRHSFDRSYLVAAGSPVEIIWRRAGFEPVVQEVTVNSPGTIIAPPDTSDARKAISPASFYITGQNKQPVGPEAECVVKVNGVEINEPVTFTYAELERAQVEISARGFFPYSGRLDLASTTQALVQLMELRKIYRFELPVRTADHAAPVRFEIRSKKAITESPVEGYITADGNIAEGSSKINNLIYVGSRARRSYIVAAVAAAVALLLGVLIGYLAFNVDEAEEAGFAAAEPVATAAAETLPPAPEVPDAPIGPEAPAGEDSGTSAETEVRPAETPAENIPAAEAPSAADLAAAVAYLDANKVWVKADMEAFAALAGLFDDMNAYRFDRLKGPWAEKLKDSKSFAAVAKAAKMSAGKRDPRSGKHSPTYNPDPADTSIHWVGYTYWIDP